MKLAELGLKQKPETKYVAGGYISFSTSNKELHYEIHSVTKEFNGICLSRDVRDGDHLNHLLASKSVNEAVQL